MTYDARDDEMTNTSGRYLIGDAALDALAEAELMWERNVGIARWWETGDLDAGVGFDAA